MASPVSYSYTPANAMATTTFNSLHPLHLSTLHNFPLNNLNFLSFPTSKSSSALHFHCRAQPRRLRSVVTRAGPTSSQLIFAFVFPTSLLAITVFTAFRIGDRLDQKFLDELAMNEAMREAEEEEADDLAEVITPRIEEPALPRTRNRPKREV